MNVNALIDALWLMAAVAFFSFSHPIAGTVCLLMCLMRVLRRS